MTEINLCPKTIRKQNIDEILYNTYSTGGWNPDYEQIPVQRRLKFMNNVVKDVIKNPELAKNDRTYAKIFEACMRNVKKHCKKIPPEKIEPFCKSYTKNILNLDEKYVPQVMATLFNIEEILESFDSGLQSAQNSIKAMGISYDNTLKASQAAFIQNTIRPNNIINENLKLNASVDAYKQTG